MNSPSHISVVLFFILFNSCGTQSIDNSFGRKADHSLWTIALAQHVDEKGMVNYNQWVQNQENLDNYLKHISNLNPNSTNWTEQDQLSFWINAYNAYTIRLILDHWPVSSIKNIKKGIPFINSVWDKKFFKINGKKMDLNEIEHAILRRKNEPRIHFAINCASISCPVLLNQAFLPDKLDEQLEAASFRFINDDQRNIISENEVQLSKIFKWFSRDFKENGTLIEFIQKYTSVQLSKDTKVNYLDYNWGINAAE